MLWLISVGGPNMGDHFWNPSGTVGGGVDKGGGTPGAFQRSQFQRISRKCTLRIAMLGICGGDLRGQLAAPRGASPSQPQAGPSRALLGRGAAQRHFAAEQHRAGQRRKIAGGSMWAPSKGAGGAQRAFQKIAVPKHVSQVCTPCCHSASASVPCGAARSPVRCLARQRRNLQPGARQAPLPSFIPPIRQ
jgi:hypothetical protein